MPVNLPPSVVRVRGITSRTESEALSLLEKTITRNLTRDEIQRIEFKVSIVPSCYDHDERHVGLIDFTKGLPGFLTNITANPLAEIQVEINDDADLLVFDCHFQGLTQLYKEELGEDTMDVVAISGLNGHAYGSWQSRGSPRRMWLRHFLAADLPYCRTMIFGYNTKLSTLGIHTINDYATELLEEICRIRDTDETRTRPLVFVAHSFGGIVLARAMIRSALSQSLHQPAIADFVRYTTGLLLFAVPHRGLDVTDMTEMVSNILENNPRLDLVGSISSDSQLLEYQVQDFRAILDNCKIVSFYERLQTRQLKQNEDGSWARTGPSRTVLNEAASVLQLPVQVETRFPVDADHSDIAKLQHKDTNVYQKALKHLRQCSKKALEVQRPTLKRKRSDDISWSERLMETFRFRCMDDREDTIEEAQRNTFRWITQGLSKEALSSSVWSYRIIDRPEDPTGLMNWLECGSGIFRIIGKAGCGKSTLMKLLTSETACTQAINKWAGEFTPLTVKFFAWRAGDILQKSRKGFLQTLFHQIFTQDPSLIDVVLQRHESAHILRNSTASLSNDPSNWSNVEINRFWSRFLKSRGWKLCIFLDGLDEFTESMQEIANLIGSAIRSSNGALKLVIAGRHEPQFDERLPSLPFYLHDWTEPDIRQLVRTAFKQHPLVDERALIEPRAFNELIQLVVEKAEGVFIWVKAAITSLLDGIIESDTIEDLVRRLDDLPSEMSDLYSSILLRMPRERLQQAATYFSLLEEMQDNRFARQRRVFTLALDYDRRDSEWIVKSASTTEFELGEKTQRVTRRVLAYCSHFVSVSGLANPEDARFGYIHRSAYDFLRSAEASRNVFCHATRPDQNWNAAIFVAAMVEGMIYLHHKYGNFSRIALMMRSAEKLFDDQLFNPRLGSVLCPLDSHMSAQIWEVISRGLIDELPCNKALTRSPAWNFLEWKVKILNDNLTSIAPFNKEFGILAMFALSGFDVFGKQTIINSLQPSQKVDLFTFELIGRMSSTWHFIYPDRLLKTYAADTDGPDQRIIGAMWYRTLQYLAWLTEAFIAEPLDRMSSHCAEGWAHTVVLWMLELVRAGADVNQTCDAREGCPNGVQRPALEVLRHFELVSGSAFAHLGQYHPKTSMSAHEISGQVITEILERGGQASIVSVKASNTTVPQDWKGLIPPGEPDSKFWSSAIRLPRI